MLTVKYCCFAPPSEGLYNFSIQLIGKFCLQSQVEVQYKIFYFFYRYANLIGDVDSLDAVFFQKGYYRSVKFLTSLVEELQAPL
jgi:hypothetical protein